MLFSYLPILTSPSAPKRGNEKPFIHEQNIFFRHDGCFVWKTQIQTRHKRRVLILIPVHNDSLYSSHFSSAWRISPRIFLPRPLEFSTILLNQTYHLGNPTLLSLSCFWHVVDLKKNFARETLCQLAIYANTPMRKKMFTLANNLALRARRIKSSKTHTKNSPHLLQLYHSSGVAKKFFCEGSQSKNDIWKGFHAILYTFLYPFRNFESILRKNFQLCGGGSTP